MYRADDIAQYIIMSHEVNNKPLSNLRLQKILFFTQSYYMTFIGNPCFEDELVAWDYGAVVPMVFFKYSFFGADNIHPVTNTIVKIDQNDREIINYIICCCDTFSTRDLVRMSMNCNAWKDVYVKGKENIVHTESLISIFPERN